MAPMAAVGCRLQVAVDANDATAAVDDCPLLPAEPQLCVISEPVTCFRAVVAYAVQGRSTVRLGLRKNNLNGLVSADRSLRSKAPSTKDWQASRKRCSPIKRSIPRARYWLGKRGNKCR